MKKIIFNHLRLLIVPVLSCFSLLVYAQNMDSVVTVYGDQYLSERAYLHYDKATYAPGETVWFKAYLMEGITIGDSKTLYVDWTDSKGAVLLHTVSPVVYGVTNGQFDIPDTYAGGFIHVRAYTKWMLNFDTAFLYKKDIRVLTKTPASATPVAVIPTLQFFPEGGDAVAGIQNKIAFKVTDQWGRPVRIKGIVQDNTGAVIDSLRTLHDGMGYFILTPQPNAVYTAKWKDNKGTEHTTSLPAVKQAGIALQVTASGNKRHFTISRTADAPDNLKSLHLVGTVQQHLAFKANVNLENNTAGGGNIPVSGIPSGILTVTVFDKYWNAVAERITFINNQDYAFTTGMTVQHWGLNKRARNEIRISVPDSIIANLSISVTDSGIEKDSSDNIISHLLLTGDIKGQVYNPAYYFSNNSDSVVQHLDLVMLTNGWRRFKWEDVVKGRYPAITYPKDTSYLSLSGKLYGYTQSGLEKGNTLTMILRQKDSSGAQFVLAPIAPNGTFNNPDFIFFDTLHIYYQPPKALRGTEVRFMESRLPPLRYSNNKNFIANNFIDTIGSYRHYQLASEQVRLAELTQTKTLSNVTVQAKTKPRTQVMDEKYTRGLFSGGDSYNFDILNDPIAQSSLNIFQYLQGRVAGLQISNSTGGTPSLQWRGGAPQLYLDEVPTNPDMISSIPVSDVAYVKVFRPPFMGTAGGGSGGAIAIYTRRGDDVQSAPGKGLANNIIIGYTPVKEFYAPNYDSFNQRNEQQDIRTTLYWNPQLLLTPQRHAVNLTFYNNDVSKSFRVVIEGMTRDGLLTHMEQIME